MSSYAYVSLSLIGLCALAGAGVGVGSGVAMMYSQMAQAEQEQKTSGAVAHSPGTASLVLFTPDSKCSTYCICRVLVHGCILICCVLLQLRGGSQHQLVALLHLAPRASKL